MNAFIEFPKPLIGLVNGPAVGVSVTTLGLFDAVYASDRVGIRFYILPAPNPYRLIRACA